jgi:hypothetical protein
MVYLRFVNFRAASVAQVVEQYHQEKEIFLVPPRKRNFLKF